MTGAIIMDRASIAPSREIIFRDVAGIAAPARNKTMKEQQDIIGLEKFCKEISDADAAIAFVEERPWGRGCLRAGARS